MSARYYDNYDKKLRHERSYSFPITLRPTTKQEWFALWLILVIGVVLVCLLIMIFNKPLDEYDFMQYITNKNQFLPKSQVEANIYALTHHPHHLSDLSSEQLLYLPSKYIPNITDFTEDLI
jgi:hypothetical protein